MTKFAIATTLQSFDGRKPLARTPSRNLVLYIEYNCDPPYMKAPFLPLKFVVFYDNLTALCILVVYMYNLQHSTSSKRWRVGLLCVQLKITIDSGY